jgi:hypothetical protein
MPANPIGLALLRNAAMIDGKRFDLFGRIAAMTERTIQWGFRPHRPALDRTDELIGLWRRARTVAENMPACPCHGIISGVIDPDVMEHNMLAPLRARYRDEGPAELAELVEARLRQSPFAGMRAAFPRWLQSLPEAPLEPSARTVFFDDLRATLLSYADAAPQFTCA